MATDAAVMRTLDQGRTWQVLGLGLPNTSCRSLALHPQVDPPVLRVGTTAAARSELGTLQGRAR